MDARIDRYLDGDLTEAEALAFRRDLAADPALEAELGAWERTLAAYAEAWPGGPAAGFEDRVMETIATAAPGLATGPEAGVRRTMMTGAAEGRRFRQNRSRSRGRAVPTWSAAAAALVTCFGLGLAASRLLPGFGPGLAGDPEAPVTGASFASAGADRPDRGPALVPVRLVFVPEETEVSTVAVAGSFNGWDPAATPMQRRDGLWTAVLLLPAGSHEYMFVLDGREWRTDPLALQRRDDGFGRENAVIDLAL